MRPILVKPQRDAAAGSSPAVAPSVGRRLVRTPSAVSDSGFRRHRWGVGPGPCRSGKRLRVEADAAPFGHPEHPSAVTRGLAQVEGVARRLEPQVQVAPFQVPAGLPLAVREPPGAGSSTRTADRWSPSCRRCPTRCGRSTWPARPRSESAQSAPDRSGARCSRGRDAVSWPTARWGRGRRPPGSPVSSLPVGPRRQ
jgi:hypothetical protein